MTKSIDRIKLAIIGLLLAGVFYPSQKVMINWWRRDDYNYCYLIPFVVLYLLWNRREELSRTAFQRSWAGLIPFCFGLALFWIGELSGEYFTLYLASWFVLLGVCWMHMGWQALKIILFPLVFLTTMFPPPNFIFNRLSLNLKLLSSKLGVGALQLYGMSAYREGNIIDLGFTQLQVVDACSGLRYLIPLIVLSILIAYFSRAALWKKILLVLSAIPISILVNGLRIALTGILYPVWGPRVAEGFFHDFSGWLIFMASLGMLIGLMWLLNRTGSGTTGLALTRGGAQVLQSIGTHRRRTPVKGHSCRPDTSRGTRTGFFHPAHFWVAALLLGATLVAAQTIEFREKINIKKPFGTFPMRIGQWSGATRSIDKSFLDQLDLNDYILADFHDRRGRTVNFYTAYYESQRKGESIHSPASCLPGSGWVLHDARRKELSAMRRERSPLPVIRAVMQKDGSKQLIYYWFPCRGRILTNAYELKLYNFWDALTRQRTDGALVRVITAVYDDEELSDAEQRLTSFTRDMLPVLNEFLPE